MRENYYIYMRTTPVQVDTRYTDHSPQQLDLVDIRLALDIDALDIFHTAPGAEFAHFLTIDIDLRRERENS